GQSGFPFTVLHVQLEAEAVFILGMRRLPRRRSRHERRDVGGVGLVRVWKSAGDIGPLPLHRRRVVEHEESHDQQQERPVRGDRKASGDQKAAKVQWISRVRVRSTRRQPLVLGDVSRGPRAHEHSDERDRPTDSESERGGPSENQITNAEYEAKWKSELLGNLGIGQSASSVRRFRAMTIRWISEVPSPISQILASRNMRSTGYSLV